MQRIDDLRREKESRHLSHPIVVHLADREGNRPLIYITYLPVSPHSPQHLKLNDMKPEITIIIMVTGCQMEGSDYNES